MIFLQLAILLICIFIGARMSGIVLGVMGMIGLLILLFVFGLQPSDPPLEEMLMLASAGLIILLAKTTATRITKASLFSPAVIAG